MEILSNYLNREMVVFIISMVPVIELRGAIPVAIALDMKWYFAYLLCVFGNLIPVPFIIAYMKPVFNYIKKLSFMQKPVRWIENRTMKKAEKVMKYSYIALFAFVAIPIPGTGAWTGAMIAALLDMRIKKAFPSIAVGVIVAGAIITLLSYHLI